MEIKELMIGDLVLCGKEPMKVDYDIFLPGHLTESHTPIPLTEEMLEVNGFKYDGDFWVYKKKEVGNIILRFCSEDEAENDYMSEKAYNYYINHWIVDESYRIDYVHELQHALRTSDLREVADNFKIEVSDNF